VLAQAASSPPQSALLQVDFAQLGPAIPPYVYGQFIEHLGRCIRDGIWAEKLRDRKFLLEPGKSWEVVKPEGAVCEVFHDPAGAYAGDHCLALWVRDAKGGPCGIRQGGIGLVAGKEYTGYAILAHVGAPQPVEARLSWGAGDQDCQSMFLDKVAKTYQRFPLRFRAGATTDDAALSLTLKSEACLWIACLSLMPADNLKGMRRDTLELIRILNPPVTRWPGGNFVSGYNWKDGIGERDRRPPRWERAWNDVEDNDFGLDEFMAFCAEVGTEPYVAVNAGLGSVQDAADEVEYANGPPGSRWGSARANNGHAEPYQVAWWGVGNEMYGDWQLGHVPVERYALRHNAFVAAMRAKDPRLKIIAVGNPGRWNNTVLPLCAGNLDLLSGHHYTERKLRLPFSADDAASYESQFLNYSDSVAAGIRGLVADFRRRLGQGNAAVDRLRLAIDEWGLVRDWNSAPDGPGVGAFEHYYCLGDAVMLGRGLHEILRSVDVVAMANWAQTVNVIGTIKTSRNQAALDPAGHLLALYRAHLAGVLVPCKLSMDVPLDAVAGWDQKNRALSLGLINYSPDRDLALEIQLTGFPKPRRIAAWRINGPSLGAINVPGQPETVTTTRLTEPVALDKPVTLLAHSITVVECK